MRRYSVRVTQRNRYNRNTIHAAEGERPVLETVKARYSKGTLVPLEPLDLEEGEEVTVSINDTRPTSASRRTLHTVAGAWKGTHDPEELLRSIYSDRLLDSSQGPQI